MNPRQRTVAKVKRQSTKISLQKRGFNSVTHHNLVHQTIPIPRVMKIMDAKAAIGKRVGKARKLASMASDGCQEKKTIQKAQKEGRTVHLATLMDFFYLKNSEFEQKFQKYRGRVELRGDVGSSASQMTAAKVLDVIARLSGCAGQASDAVSACTQVKMDWIPPPRYKCPSASEDQSCSRQDHGISQTSDQGR